MKRIITELDGATNATNADTFHFMTPSGQALRKMQSMQQMSTRELRRKAERQARRRKKKGKM